MHITAPVAGARWTVDQPALIEWQLAGYDGDVQIALNRNYPTGIWEMLAQNVPNTGVAVVSVNSPVSAHCRLRVSAMNDPYTWISDGDFSLQFSQGFLALVNADHTDTPLISWNGGVRECAGAISDTFYFRNFGAQPCMASLETLPNTLTVSDGNACGGEIHLQPGEISPCYIVFAAGMFAAAGVLNDSFAVQTDAVNHDATGHLWFHLKATVVTTPKAPVVTIAAGDNSLSSPLVPRSVFH